MPYKSKALQYNKYMTYYTAANNKFDGYTQFAKPRDIPYVNRKQMLKLNSKKRKFVKQLKADFKGQLRVPRNSTTFFKQKFFQTSYLSGTINQMNKYEKQLQSKRIASRQMSSSVDFVHRIKDKQDKGRVKPV